ADGTLESRDAYAARRIAAAVRAHPGARVLTLTGQLHVAPPHLPAAVQRALGEDGRHLQSITVYQNCEDIYWALQRGGHELDGAALREALDGVQVYTAGDLSFLQTLSNRGFSKKEIHTIERQILARESYYIPRARIAYLANLSVNHAAEEATHFLRHVVSGA